VRTPGCATVGSHSRRGGLIGAENALSAFYAVVSCGPTDEIDITFTGLAPRATFVINTDPSMLASAVTLNGVHDFNPGPVDNYTLDLTVVEHSTGQVPPTTTEKDTTEVSAPQAG
jgi:hypothetical protein